MTGGTILVTHHVVHEPQLHQGDFVLSVSEQREPDTRFVRFVAHRNLLILVGIGLAFSLLDLDKFVFDEPIVPPVLDVVTVLAGTIAMAISLTCGIKHSRILCEDCFREMPLDPQQAVDDHRRKLEFFHLIATPRGGLILLVSLVAAGVLRIVLGAYQFPLTVAVWAFLLYEDQVFHRHRILQPWCCGDEGGGDDEITPVPPPVRTATQ